jgi:DNA-binding transcriptional MerR regulator
MEDLVVNPVVETEIPDKLCFRIGEVAKLAGVKPHVLRFWEAEFRGLGPKKSGTGHRVYRRKDVVFVLEIKRLLYEKRFTIEGARKYLESHGKKDPVPTPSGRSQGELFSIPLAFSEVRRELKELAELLKDPPGKKPVAIAK